MNLDIVIPVREGGPSEQLRYALRSFHHHLPHRRVWIVGGRPAWLRNVGHIRTRQSGTKYQNTTTAIRAVCEHPDVSESFIYCNDDFFVMKPTAEVPALHRGPVLAVETYYAGIRSGRYLRGMRDTRRLLQSLGHADPLSYELHVPMAINKALMLKALDIGSKLDVVHKRTLYGNLAGVGGQRQRDVKVLTRGSGFPRDGVFLSTMQDTFRRGAVGAHIRDRFETPSPYEKGGRRHL